LQAGRCRIPTATEHHAAAADLTAMANGLGGAFRSPSWWAAPRPWSGRCGNVIRSPLIIEDAAPAPAFGDISAGIPPCE